MTDEEKKAQRIQLHMAEFGITAEQATEVDERAGNAVMAAMAAWQAGVMDPAMSAKGLGLPLAEIGIAWLKHDVDGTLAMMREMKAEHVANLNTADGLAAMLAEEFGMDVQVIRMNLDDDDTVVGCGQPDCPACGPLSEEAGGSTKH